MKLNTPVLICGGGPDDHLWSPSLYMGKIVTSELSTFSQKLESIDTVGFIETRRFNLNTW